MSIKNEIAPKGMEFKPTEFRIGGKFSTIMTIVSFPKIINILMNAAPENINIDEIRELDIPKYGPIFACVYDLFGDYVGVFFKLYVEGKEHILTPGHSVDIAVKEIHSLQNPFKEVLKIVEVQKGDILIEEDIVRYEDITCTAIFNYFSNAYYCDDVYGKVTQWEK